MTRQELLARLDRAAEDLEVVQLPMVFVGGATMPLYVDDEARELRETKDVDVMVEGTSYGEFAELEERLRTAGFQHDTSRHAPRCRWLKGGQQYDIESPATYEPSLGRSYEVASYPTTYVLDGGGEVVAAHSGEAPRAAYEGWIEEALG